MAVTESESSQTGTVWVMDLEQPAPQVVPGIAASFKQVGDEAAGALAELMGLADPAEIRRRFNAHRRCYTAWVEAELAAYGWVSLEDEDVGELGLRLKLRPGEAYIWDCATGPARRGRGLYTALLGQIIAGVRAEGCTRAWIGANRANTPSQTGIDRAGFLAVMDITIQPGTDGPFFTVRARPGVAPALVDEARRLFFGNRDPA